MWLLKWTQGPGSLPVQRAMTLVRGYLSLSPGEPSPRTYSTVKPRFFSRSPMYSAQGR
ncbi:hypothetical protein D3C75_1239730 [compost metagenome]